MALRTYVIHSALLLSILGVFGLPSFVSAATMFYEQLDATGEKNVSSYFASGVGGFFASTTASGFDNNANTYTFRTLLKTDRTLAQGAVEIYCATGSDSSPATLTNAAPLVSYQLTFDQLTAMNDAANTFVFIDGTFVFVNGVETCVSGSSLTLFFSWTTGPGSNNHEFVAANITNTLPYVRIYYDGAVPPDELPPTHISAFTPQGGLVATSTAFDIGVEGVVHEDNFVENMEVKLRLYNNAGISSNAIVGPSFSVGGQYLCGLLPFCTPEYDETQAPLQADIVNKRFEFAVDDPGEFSYSTTTDVQQIGKYTLEGGIYRPTVNLFGIGIGSTLVYGSTTSFVVGTSTAFDAYQEAASEFLDSLGEAASTAASECTIDFTTAFGLGDLNDCMAYLFTGAGNVIGGALTNNVNDLFSRAPWGYATRVYTILTTDTSTTTLPSLGVEIPDSLPGAGKSFDFSPWEPTESAVAMFSVATTSTMEGSVLENFEHWWNIMWYIVFGLWVLSELYGSFGQDLEHVGPAIRQKAGPRSPGVSSFRDRSGGIKGYGKR